MPHGLFQACAGRRACAGRYAGGNIPATIATALADTLDDVDDADDLRPSPQAASTCFSCRAVANGGEDRRPSRRAWAGGTGAPRIPGRARRRRAASASRRSTAAAPRSGMPMAAARWAIGASIEISRSSCDSAVAASAKSKMPRPTSCTSPPAPNCWMSFWCMPPCRLNTSNSGSPASARKCGERRRALAVQRLAGHRGPVDADAQLGLLEAAELDAARRPARADRRARAATASKSTPQR